MNILQVQDLTKTVPGKTLFQDINFAINSGDKIGLVARNGAGKTTLLKILAGKEEEETGKITMIPSVRLGYLSQSETFLPTDTVLEAVFHHESEIGQVIKAYEVALKQGDDDKLTALVHQIDEMNGWDYETNVRIVINKLQLTDLLDQTIEQCSGGELKRLALAKLLIYDPDFLILDEPTNHLDLEMIEWLEIYLKRSKRTILLVTHDRYFLERVCDTMFELDHGSLYAYTGNYSKFLELKQKREEDEAQQQHQLKQVMRRELEWMRKAPRARETKSVKREKEFYELEKKYKSGKKHQHTMKKTIELSVAQKRIGGKIVDIKALRKAFGEKIITDDFNYSFRNGERVGIIGKNGVGKSTFINMLMGEELPDSGHITCGDTVTMALYQQKQKPIDESKKIIDIVKDVAEYITIGGGKQISASYLLDKFLFPPEQQQQRAHTLSGGEKRRLHLLTILIKNPNFLILDEPTNDLDLQTMAILEEFLMSFRGCLVIVSHDRFFMDKVVDHLLVFEGRGEINEFPGTYSERKDSLKNPQKKVIVAAEETNEIDEPVSDTVHHLTKQATKKKSLSNKEREEYTRLGTEIERLEGEKELINNRMATEQLDHVAIKELSQSLGKIAMKLEEYEERWFELAERK